MMTSQPLAFCKCGHSNRGHGVYDDDTACNYCQCTCYSVAPCLKCEDTGIIEGAHPPVDRNTYCSCPMGKHQHNLMRLAADTEVRMPEKGPIDL